MVAGFEGEQILTAIAALVKLQGKGRVANFYPSAVTREGNLQARAAVAEYFEPADAAWRGMGIIPGSGMVLRKEYEAFDAGSRELTEDREKIRMLLRAGAHRKNKAFPVSSVWKGMYAADTPGSLYGFHGGQLL